MRGIVGFVQKAYIRRKIEAMINEVEVKLKGYNKVAVSLTDKDEIKLSFIALDKMECVYENVLTVKELMQIVNAAKMIFDNK